LRGKGWQEFLQLVRERIGQQVQAYLRSVRDIAVGGNQVAFAFGGNEFVREQLARPETLVQVALILSEHLGTQVAVDCQVGDHAHLSATIQTQHLSTRSDGPDPLVEFAISELNAHLEGPATQKRS
jgi:hypothetical protein